MADSVVAPLWPLHAAVAAETMPTHTGGSSGATCTVRGAGRDNYRSLSGHVLNNDPLEGWRARSMERKRMKTDNNHV